MKADHVMQDLKALMEHAEHLADVTKDEVTEEAREARERLRKTVAAVRRRCGVLEDGVRQGWRTADRVVRRRPYQTVGVVFAAGVLLGAWLARRRAG